MPSQESRTLIRELNLVHPQHCGYRAMKDSSKALSWTYLTYASQKKQKKIGVSSLAICIYYE